MFLKVDFVSCFKYEDCIPTVFLKSDTMVELRHTRCGHVSPEMLRDPAPLPLSLTLYLVRAEPLTHLEGQA